MKTPSLPTKLYPRGRLDLSWRDLLFGALAPCLPGPRPQRVWPTKRPHLAVFSVRTAWDALLCVQKWPPGSEIIISEANIPDMVRLIEAHGLVPVTVPLDPYTLQVETSAVREALTERTRAILVSPLFGARMEFADISKIADERGILLVEDAAQAFSDPSYQGAPEADVTLFSFGLIKTRTALSGGVVFARDARLLKAIERQISTYPRIRTSHFYARVGRALLLQLFSHPLLFGALWRVLQKRGIDPDSWLSQATRGMKGPDWLVAIRHQPHTGTLKLLRRRLHERNPKSLHQRIERGIKSVEFLPTALGKDAPNHAFWALSVELSNREEFIERAHEEGFDVSFRTSSLTCHGKDETLFSKALGRSVFLPIGTPMPECEWARLLRLASDGA